MASQVQTLITRREFNFTSLATNSNMTIVAVRAVDTSFGATGELVVRVHANSCAGSSTITVIAAPVSISPEEPQTDFVSPAALHTTETISASTGSSVVLIRSLTAPYGSMIQLQVKGTEDSSGNVARATISVDLVLRE